MDDLNDCLTFILCYSVRRDFLLYSVLSCYSQPRYLSQFDWIMRKLPVRLIVCAALVSLTWLVWVVMLPVHLSKPYTLKAETNRTLSQVAYRLVEDRVIRSATVMIALARLAGIDRRFEAGVYHFSDAVSMLDILKRLAERKPDEVSMTIVEGWTFRQLRQALENTQDVRLITRHWSDAQILAALGASQLYAEGLVFPSTYFFVPGTTDLMLLKRAYNVMQKKLNAIWEAREANLPYLNSYEMLIVASLIEKETSQPQDRPLVAAVFINRLKRGMRLQTDPAVIYGLGDSFAGRLRKADLQRDTPFNTYTRMGLPPTPIALPSEASLVAAAHPARSGALYFVAKGNGHSYFSETLDEHNNAIRRYLLKRGS